MDVYSLKGAIGDAVRLETIFKGIMWFLAMDIVTLAIPIAFPETSLWLPTLMPRSRDARPSHRFDRARRRAYARVARPSAVPARIGIMSKYHLISSVT